MAAIKCTNRHWEGEWFGLGLGNGLQKNLYLPEPHTDFIFAVIVEEFGLVGG